jgi:Erv1 / Alr family
MCLYILDSMSPAAVERFVPEVWGPHYWFFLHTVAHTYPLHPNDVVRRKYYDLLMNFPLFIPNESIGNRFSEMLDAFPVTPYLANRDSLIRWVHFMHNRYNAILGKEEYSLHQGIDAYFDNYAPKPFLLSETLHIKTQYVYLVLIAILFILIYIYY